MDFTAFTDKDALRVGGLVAGPSAHEVMLDLLRASPSLSEEDLRATVLKNGWPTLYELDRIEEDRFLWWSRCDAFLRPLSGGEMLKVSLLPPPFDWTFSPYPQQDNRFDWRMVDEYIHALKLVQEARTH